MMSKPSGPPQASHGTEPPSGTAAEEISRPQWATALTVTMTMRHLTSRAAAQGLRALTDRIQQATGLAIMITSPFYRWRN